ncbi:MAG: hypothetical protein COZ46_00195 [Verrucomicrobia bacterium CG_4_10_14_3_um_filter_43_23]|nr:MAG: hypothetical protein AUJ82_04745 [Verrucomicrobia bacterium CG1_02_43_26]PIP58998.1 MAG: hypothetical protein COX01_05460 [Verrucomicrobia bacterium CG22_combo_CG10-13_8_21_14_all_43_17]PIX59096.1 MAG: hypothetical protein COZ46_00195 [Verrucomicrobia bacterium CG_4_10_14_3_um_filter_43_23]PIY61382.1 MAG: hypothetical protein COY94_05915 [Verrucomicrobia bacterium CG_4_10_14_0_8_um_filter_43_34]PJA44164.1 MAG: hypothetical protein CO175_04630 [Verrucomicrobia bacterium CG_4_9_14_3_um_fi
MRNSLSTPISIIMANYNHGHYISEALDGLIHQTYLPAEIIIIDDCSTDNSRQVIQDWQKDYPDLIRVYHNNENMGVMKTIDRGLELSKHEYILFHSADDWLHPTCLEKFMHLLESYPDSAFCCSEPTYFHKSTEEPFCYKVYWRDTPGYISPNEIVDKLNGHWIPGYTLVKKSALLDAGGINHKFRWNADWFWLLVMAFRHGFCFIPESLTFAREEAQSYLHAGIKNEAEMEKFYFDLLEALGTKAYEDVRPSFIKSCALSNFGADLAKSVLKYPERLNFVSWALIQRNVHMWTEQVGRAQDALAEKNAADTLGGHFQKTPERCIDLLQYIVPKIVEFCELEGYGRVAFYGAGNHTTLLLKYWHANSGPEVVKIISSQVVSEKEFQGLPIQAIKDMQEGEVDAVILSSMTYEKDMLNACRKFIPNTVCLPIWNTRETFVSQEIRYGLEKMIPWLIKCVRRKYSQGKIALFGIGGHTEELLNLWELHKGPSIDMILTTKPYQRSLLRGIPIMAITSIDLQEVDCVILSSQSHEKEMHEIAQNFIPGIAIERLWTLAEKGETARL